MPERAFDLAAARLRNQRLVGEGFADPAGVVRWLGAVQAQDYHGAKWALAQRTRGVDAFDNAAFDRAFDDGAILRTHVMRPTWHFVHPADLRWLLALTAPRVHAVNAGYYRKMELDDATMRRGLALVEAALADGRPRTRQELAAALEAGGVAASGMRLAYLVMHAELEGLVCSGPLRGRQFTYALLEARVPPAPAVSRDEALATLTRRYFTSHGPATPHDFSWWSGLTLADARRGLEIAGSDVEPVVLHGKTYWRGAPAEPAAVEAPVVHLLPNYDEHVVAYRDHGPSCDPAALAVLHMRGNGGLDAHLVALNGLVVGGWRRTVQASRVAVRLDLLVAFGEAERAALERAVAAYGRFMGLPVVVEGAG